MTWFLKDQFSGDVSEKSVFQKPVSKKRFSNCRFHGGIFAWLIPGACCLALGLRARASFAIWLFRGEFRRLRHCVHGQLPAYAGSDVDVQVEAVSEFAQYRLEGAGFKADRYYLVVVREDD